jgi:hypothetical protein
MSVNMRYERLFLFGCLGIGIFIAIHSWAWSQSPPAPPATPSEQNSAAHVSAAIDYHNKAAEIENNAAGGGVVGTISQAEWSAIISYDKKALEEAQQADISDMNRDYPGFGDHFQNEFIQGLRLVINNGDDWSTAPAFFKGQILIDRFGNWYEANWNAIRNEK